MMQCPKCSFDAGAAKFCPQCGLVLDADFKPKRRMMPLFVVLGAAAVVAALLFATGVLRLRGKDADPALNISAESQRPVLAVRGNEAPSVVNQTAVTMPDDVRKWLEHLKRIDRERETHGTEYQLTLLANVGSLAPVNQAEQGTLNSETTRRKSKGSSLIGNVDDFYSDLTSRFQAISPPVECGQIASDYSALLLESQAMVREVTSAVEHLDIDGLRSMKNTSFKRVDERGSETNQRIAAICAKYHEPNKYAVFVDRGSVIGIGAALTDSPSLGLDQKAYLKLVDELINEGIGQ